MASEIVHITFEKLTGLKGTFEGEFVCDVRLDFEAPFIFEGFLTPSSELLFRQSDKSIILKPVQREFLMNYLEHFHYGVNFIIKQVANGRGERSTINSQSLN